MSSVFSGGSGTMDGVLHITSLERSEGDLLNNDSFPDTIFHSSFKDMILVSSVSQIYPTGPTIYHNGTSPEYNSYIRPFPDSIKTLFGGSSVSIGFAISPSTGQCAFLHSTTQFMFNCLIDPYYGINFLNSTSYDGLGVGTRFNHSNNPGFLTCKDSAYSVFSSLINSSDLYIKIYTLNIDYNTNSLFYNLTPTYLYNDIELSNYSMYLNGVDIVDLQFLSMDYSSYSPFSIQGVSTSITTINSNGTMSIPNYGNKITVSDISITPEITEIHGLGIDLKLNSVYHKLFHSLQRNRVKSNTTMYMSDGTGNNFGFNCNSSGLLILYPQKLDPSTESSGLTVAKLLGVQQPFFVFPIYKNDYSLNLDYYLFYLEYWGPDTGYWTTTSLRISLNRTSDTQFNINRSYWFLAGDTTFIPHVYVQFLEFY